MKQIRKRNHGLLLAATLFMMVIFLTNGSSVYGATWSRTMSNGFVPSAGDAIPLKNSNVVVKSKASAIKQISYNGSTVWCAKIASASKAQSYSNFLTLTFPKAAKLRGQEIDITIAFTAMIIGKGQGKDTLLNKDGYAAFARCNSTGRFYIGGIDSSTSRPYKANKQITTKITATWSSGGGTVSLPFYQGVTDVDAGMSADYYKEAWEGASGFAGTFYVWPGCKNTISGNKMTASYADVDGNNSWYQCGLVAPTTGGTFTVKWTEGNCETGFLLYNQYKDLPTPTKTVDKTSAVKDDLITWMVNQKVGTFYRDMFTPYSSFVISDPIPDGVTYQSARVLKGGQDITNSAGTLRHDPGSDVVTYTFNSSTLDPASPDTFYNGDTITLEIKATVELPEAVSENIDNTGATVISGESQDTNTVRTVVKRPDMGITKTVAKSIYQSYDTVIYTVKIKQGTPGLTLKNLEVTDPVPKQVALSGKPTLSGVFGTVSVSGNTWTASIDELDYGETATIIFSGKLEKIRIAKYITNEVTAEADDVPDASATAQFHAQPIPLDINVEKFWDDEEDFYELRPDTVEIELLQDGSPIKEMTLRGNDWKGTFSGLPEYKTETQQYTYTVREAKTPTGYEDSVKRNTVGEGEFDRNFDITNTLIYYDLNLNKQIVKSDWYAPHGDATFLYRITSKRNPDWKWYEQITFHEEDVKNGGDTLKKSKTLKLPYGAYEVEELDVLRYKGEITDTSDGVKKINALKAEAQMGPDEPPKSVTYQNEKVRWDRYSHNDLVINKLKQ